MGAAWVPPLCLAAACGPRLTAGAAAPFPPEVAEVVAANQAVGDPYQGRFPFSEAVDGLAPSGPLRAKLVTDEGEIRCVLTPEDTPLSVANFVGLARGLRPFKGDDDTWQRIPYYDGLVWHRAIEGEFVQTGRRGRQATGGFFLQDEFGLGDSFDNGGVMAMANTGTPHSGSVQFFITTNAAKHLAGQHTIIGHCDGEAVVRRLERRVARTDGEPRLERVEIERG